MLAPMQKGRSMNSSELFPSKPHHRPTRLVILCSILALSVTAGAAHFVRVHHDEDTLLEYGRAIVEQANAEDPVPVSEAGPEADVELEAYCSYAYLVAGKKTGKIRMILKPRPHAPVQKMTPICYICDYQEGAWRQVESYSEH